jgi:caffeoyl-CoA O-methyltransferase
MLTITITGEEFLRKNILLMMFSKKKKLDTIHHMELSELFSSVQIEEYVHMYTSPVSRLLQDLEQETHEKTDMPEMLTGAVEGRLLQMLVSILRARRVVDIGTFTGYSALMMAEGMPKNGELITCEISREYASIARRYFKKSPYREKIKLRPGPAIETLRQIPDESTDFVFIDADKPSYTDYYMESVRIVKKNYLIAVDNALWSGRVFDPQDEDSRAIARLNKTVRKDRRVEQVLLTVRDGIYLILKKGGK